MIAVIFEVIPAEGDLNSYLDHATKLKPILETQPGFISVERFRSLSDPDKLLSLSFFENEAAVANWRAQSAHRNSQKAGRTGLFKDYRLRVAEIQRDYGLHDRDEAPRDSRTAHS